MFPEGKQFQLRLLAQQESRVSNRVAFLVQPITDQTGKSVFFLHRDSVMAIPGWKLQNHGKLVQVLKLVH